MGRLNDPAQHSLHQIYYEVETKISTQQIIQLHGSNVVQNFCKISRVNTLTEDLVQVL